MGGFEFKPKAPPVLPAALNSPLTPSYNELPVAILNSQGAEVARREFYAPIRCVVEPPCGVCAYCKTAKNGADWWLR